MNMDPGLTSTDLAWDRALSFSPSPKECVEVPYADLSLHAKDCMSHVKNLMDGAKGCRGGVNTGTWCRCRDTQT